MKNIYLIGASTRLGYQPHLKELLLDKAHVDGPAVNCGDSANIIEYLSEWLSGQSPHIICVTCGLHDLRYDISKKTYQVPVETYAQNLGTIFGMLKDLTAAKIFWQTNTPILEDIYNNKPMIPGTQRIYHRFEKDVLAYNEAAQHVAMQHHLDIIDLYAVMVPLCEQYMLDDGIHWTDEGYKIMAREVAQALSGELEKLGD
ncbi:MAG TPA: SGNH/GDSL hydrolase family protein [Alphaproteobacteria bacterium]